MDAHSFRHLQGTIRDLNPRQIEELWAMLGRVRAEKEALAEIEGRTERDASCPHCKQHCERQKWGRTRTGVQRFRCGNCRKTYSGLTGTGICGLHRPDLFLEVIRDMMSEVPSSCRKLAERLAIASGSLFAVQVNSNFFWMFKALLGLSTTGALKTLTVV